MQDVYSVDTVLCMYQIHDVQSNRLSSFSIFQQASDLKYNKGVWFIGKM